MTQAQWRAIASLPKINLNLNPDPSSFKGGDRPVETISWLQAVEFCDRLSCRTGRNYRLPSEAEWEYTYRAGTTTPFHFGETITTDLANYRGTDWEIDGTTYPGNYGKGPKGIFRQETTQVGSFKVANAFGLFDMHGNVWERCEDHWHDNYKNAPTDGSAWVDPNAEKTALRVYAAAPGLTFQGIAVPRVASSTFPSASTTTLVFEWCARCRSLLPIRWT